MIAVSSDHAGINLKKAVVEYLNKNGYKSKDFGTCTSDSVDYPDYALLAAQAVSNGECSKAIVICGSGIGISIAANKVKGIRAANCTNSYTARMSRLHNDANVLALGERVIGIDLALEIVDTWIKTEFSREEKHQRRINKIADIENMK